MSEKTMPSATDSAQAVSSLPLPSRRSGGIRGSLQQLLAFASLIVIVAFFSFMNPHFFTSLNIVSILTSATVTGIIAL
ncbi:MAG: hypothetical protein ABUT11_02625, partial [Leifsonia sp.]